MSGVTRKRSKRKKKNKSNVSPRPTSPKTRENKRHKNRANVNEHGPLAQKINQYFRSRKKLSPDTRNYYFSILTNFSQHTMKALEFIETIDVLSYLDYLELEREWSNSSLNTASNTIRSFFTFYREQDDDLKDIMKGIERYRVDDVERPYVTDEDYNRLVSIVQKKIQLHISLQTSKEESERAKLHKHWWLDVRDLAIMTLLFTTGVRAHELLNLDVEDITKKDKNNIATSSSSIIVYGKGRGGKKMREIPLLKKTINYLNNWLRIRKSLINDPYIGEKIRAKNKQVVSDEEGPLILSRLSTRLGSKGLHNRVIYYAELIDRPDLTSHGYRHGFVTKVAFENVDTASKLAGHSSIDTTSRYIHFNTSQKRSVLDEAFKS